jgi:hypothetical protein
MGGSVRVFSIATTRELGRRTQAVHAPHGLRNSLSYPIPLNPDPGNNTVQRWGSPAANGDVVPVASFGTRRGTPRRTMTSPKEMTTPLLAAVYSANWSETNRGR